MNAAMIQREEQSFPAVQCERCGAKFYPPELMDAHKARHAAADKAKKESLKFLQEKFRSMRG